MALRNKNGGKKQNQESAITGNPDFFFARQQDWFFLLCKCPASLFRSDLFYGIGCGSLFKRQDGMRASCPWISDQYLYRKQIRLSLFF
ncbi:MAG: hypothetical protein IJM63_02285 [Solobacterium sp.]|nr:hypothetical protein [Solobacterium sp.]